MSQVYCDISNDWRLSCKRVRRRAGRTSTEKGMAHKIFMKYSGYQAVRTAYWVIKGSGVRSVNSCWMAWQTNTRSNGSR